MDLPFSTTTVVPFLIQDKVAILIDQSETAYLHSVLENSNLTYCALPLLDFQSLKWVLVVL